MTYKPNEELRDAVTNSKLSETLEALKSYPEFQNEVWLNIESIGLNLSTIAGALSDINDTSGLGIESELRRQNELHAESIQNQERVLFHLSRIADSLERLVEK